MMLAMVKWARRDIAEMENFVSFSNSYENNLHSDGGRLILQALRIAGWSSPVARQAHNLKAAGSNPAPATNFSFLTPQSPVFCNSSFIRGNNPGGFGRFGLWSGADFFFCQIAHCLLYDSAKNYDAPRNCA